MARTLRDPRPKPRAPQARLTTVFDPPRLFTSSRPKERARNKAAMERAWRRQELTEMVVARTVGRIPGASGGEAFFSRRHWDDPLRAAAEAAAEAARRNYDARGEWGSVAADLAARDAARKAAAAAARLVDAEEGRRGGGETEFDQLVREGFEALAIESDEDREAEEDVRGFSFRKTTTTTRAAKIASSDKKERRTRRAFGSDDDDSDDPYADFDRALREAARADEDPADAERSSRAAFALVPFEGAGVPYGGVDSNAPLDDPRRLMLERAAPLARSERPHSSHASRLRRGREPYPDRPMARGRFLRSGKGGAGMARGRQVAALEARSGDAAHAARLRRSLELCAGPAAAAAKAERAKAAARVGHARARARRAREEREAADAAAEAARRAVRRSARAKASSELWSSGTNAREPFARSPPRGQGRGPAAPPTPGRATLLEDARRRAAIPAMGAESDPPATRRAPASARASAGRPRRRVGAPPPRARRSRSTGTTNARTPPRRNRTTLSRRTRPSRACTPPPRPGEFPRRRRRSLARRGNGGSRRRASWRATRCDGNRREGRRSPRGRRARTWARSPRRPGRRARARKSTGSRSCASPSPRNWNGRGAPAAGGGDGRRSSRRERRGGDACFAR